MATSGVCVVLGYGPGIGDAVARRFSAGGFKVALVSRTREKVEAAAKGIANSKAFPADVTDAAALTATLASIEGDLGPINALIYNAGNGVWKPYDAITVEQVSPSPTDPGPAHCRLAHLPRSSRCACRSPFPGLSIKMDMALKTNVHGLLAATQFCCPKMESRGEGFVCVTGATASLRGFDESPLASCIRKGRGKARSACCCDAWRGTAGVTHPAWQVCHSRRPLPLQKRPSARSPSRSLASSGLCPIHALSGSPLLSSCEFNTCILSLYHTHASSCCELWPPL